MKSETEVYPHRTYSGNGCAASNTVLALSDCSSNVSRSACELGIVPVTLMWYSNLFWCTRNSCFAGIVVRFPPAAAAAAIDTPRFTVIVLSTPAVILAGIQVSQSVAGTADESTRVGKL